MASQNHTPPCDFTHFCDFTPRPTKTHPTDESHGRAADMQHDEHVHEHDAPPNQAPNISRREEMHEMRNTSCVHRTGRQERVLVLGRTSTWVCGVPPTPFARPQCTHGAPYLVLGLASRTRSLHGTCSRIPCQPRHSSKGRRRRRARAQSYLRKLPVTESIASGER
jgi:hypothetical protein